MVSFKLIQNPSRTSTIIKLVLLFFSYYCFFLFSLSFVSNFDYILYLIFWLDFHFGLVDCCICSMRCVSSPLSFACGLILFCNSKSLTTSSSGDSIIDMFRNYRSRAVSAQSRISSWYSRLVAWFFYLSFYTEYNTLYHIYEKPKFLFCLFFLNMKW